MLNWKEFVPPNCDYYVDARDDKHWFTSVSDAMEWFRKNGYKDGVVRRKSNDSICCFYESFDL